MEEETVYIYMYPVVDITDDDTQNQEISWINPKDIEHIESNKKSPIMYANGRMYRPILTVGGFEEAWSEHGHFESDKGNVVNLQHVEWYDAKRGYLYLKYDINRLNGIPVAKIHDSTIRNLMDKYGIKLLENENRKASYENAKNHPSYSY